MLPLIINRESKARILSLLLLLSVAGNTVPTFIALVRVGQLVSSLGVGDKQR